MCPKPISVHMTGSEWFGSQPGGLNRYFDGLHAALTAREDVDVVGAAFGNPPADYPNSVSWGALDRGTFSRFRASRKHLSPDPPDILDTHFSLYGPTAKSYRKRPIHVVHFQGPWAAESREAGAGRLSVRAKKAFETLKYREADRFVVLSQPFKTMLADQYEVDPSSISIIPPGVNLSDFRFEPETTRGAPQVLCVRRLERRMGIHVLIESWRAVVDANPLATLHIVGTGTYERELMALVVALNLSSSIVFHGRLDDEQLRAAYKAATITVVPSVALEGFGLIALESMAVGRVPIVTDVGGLPDGVRGLDPTLIVPAGSADALSERIVSALEGQRPGASEARQHAETFAWSTAAEKHVALYTSALEE
jgi:glycosyltransferase involved in cell wall biosynthesis